MNDGSFDSLTDKSAPGALVSDDAIWDAVREVAGGKTLYAAGNDGMVPYREGERPVEERWDAAFGIDTATKPPTVAWAKPGMIAEDRDKEVRTAAADEV